MNDQNYDGGFLNDGMEKVVLSCIVWYKEVFGKYYFKNFVWFE